MLLFSKKRFKKRLTNIILQKQFGLYSIFFLIINKNNLELPQKRLLSKLCYLENFSKFKNNPSSFPIYYITSNKFKSIITTFHLIQQYKNLNKILIYNIKIKNINFKYIENMHFYCFNNIFLHLLINTFFVFSLILFKK